jgi:formate C-acetyltransferase
MSPVQGADRAGPTALCRSLTRLDHCQLGNGMVLDCKFSPTLFADPSQRCAFRSLVETYFQLGGMEIQLNVVSRDTLLDAQAHPERHSELLVRVSGFSAYFVDLARITQDEIIARTEHAMR